MLKIKANFSQLGNDLFWSHYDKDDKSIKWSGYNDEYWWNNVSCSSNFKFRLGKITNRYYCLDAKTNDITITENSL